MKKIENLFRAQASSPSETAMLFNGGVGFKVPEYQRQYDWSEDNINRLYYDCLSGFQRLATSPNADAFTFLGTLILVEESTKEADFAGTSVSIVDGQQRLTTLTLLACALYEYLRILHSKIDTLGLDANIKHWLEVEVDTRLDELFDSAVGLQKLKGKKTFPYPRIIRAEDIRGKSKKTSEYRSPLAKFLEAFSDYPDQDEYEFVPPSLGSNTDASKLAANYQHIRKLVRNINDSDWYENTECEQVPISLANRLGYRELFERLDDVIGDEADRHRAVEILAKNSACHELVRTLLFSAYFSNCIVLTRVMTDDENAAFDIFDALNTTGEPLTALETLKPRVVYYENSKNKFIGSNAESEFLRIKENVDNQFLETSKKQSETKDLIVSFALYIEGTKQPENLSAQRNFLRTRYDKAIAKSKASADRFVSSLANMAEFRRYYWTSEGIDQLGRFHSSESVGEVQLLVSFIRDMKTKLHLPIIARYWNPDLRNSGDAQFLEALRAVAAFLVLRRGASGGTSGIDGEFRAIMAPSVGPGASKKFGLCAGVDNENKLLDIVELKFAFRKLLSSGKYKINDREKWIGQVSDNPLYQQAKELVRFLTLAAAHQSIPSDIEQGLWNREGIKISSHTNNFLNFDTWRSELYETVEHIAPESEKNSGWNEEIYKNNILRHSLGNLVLLPRKENSAIGNDSWVKKKAFYRALTEEKQEEQQKRIDEAAALGIKFSNYTTELLKKGERLSLLDPLRGVEKWNKKIIESRGKNTAGLAWDHIWPWLN